MSAVRWPPLFSPVMATGIVSIAAHQAGFGGLSLGLMCLTAVLDAVLLAYHIHRFARLPRAVLAELRTSALFDYLTSVAAGCVLAGALMLSGAGAFLAWVLFVLSGLLWLGITVALTGELLIVRSLHPRSEVQGGWLLAVVAPQALGVLAIGLARGSAAAVLSVTAFALWLLASALYPPIALLRLRRLESGRRAWARLRAEDWILPGALAISTLAGCEIVDRLAHPDALLAPVKPLLLGAVTVQFAGACALIGLLLWGELRHAAAPPSVRRAIPPATRWASVFPLGMFAVAAHAYAATAGLSPVRILGDVFFAVAVAAWLGTAIAATRERAQDLHARRRARALRAPGRDPTPTRSWDRALHDHTGNMVRDAPVVGRSEEPSDEAGSTGVRCRPAASRGSREALTPRRPLPRRRDDLRPR